MLNRIAISGGSYKDWLETVYTTDYYFRAETPVYEGGKSTTIDFEAGETESYMVLNRIYAVYRDWETDRKSTRLNSSHITRSRMPSSA